MSQESSGLRGGFPLLGFKLTAFDDEWKLVQEIDQGLLSADVTNYLFRIQDDPNEYEVLGIRPEDWPEVYDGVAAVHLAGHGLRSHLKIPPMLREKVSAKSLSILVNAT